MYIPLRAPLLCLPRAAPLAAHGSFLVLDWQTACIATLPFLLPDSHWLLFSFVCITLLYRHFSFRHPSWLCHSTFHPQCSEAMLPVQTFRMRCSHGAAARLVLLSALPHYGLPFLVAPFILWAWMPSRSAWLWFRVLVLARLALPWSRVPDQAFV